MSHKRSAAQALPPDNESPAEPGSTPEENFSAREERYLTFLHQAKDMDRASREEKLQELFQSETDKEIKLTKFRLDFAREFPEVTREEKIADFLSAQRLLSNINDHLKKVTVLARNASDLGFPSLAQCLLTSHLRSAEFRFDNATEAEKQHASQMPCYGETIPSQPTDAPGRPGRNGAIQLWMAMRLLAGPILPFSFGKEVATHLHQEWVADFPNCDLARSPLAQECLRFTILGGEEPRLSKWVAVVFALPKGELLPIFNISPWWATWVEVVDALQGQVLKPTSLWDEKAFSKTIDEIFPGLKQPRGVPPLKKPRHN